MVRSTKTVLALLLSGSLCISSWAEEAEADAVATPAEVTLQSISSELPSNEMQPPVVTAYPAIRKKYEGHEQILLKYRKNENLPEITNDAMLEGTATAKQAKEVVGTIPRLTVLPCDTGCKGNSDYEKAVKVFLKNYENPVRQGILAYRGNMTIKVRWFNERGYFKRKLGMISGYDVFAYSFPIEGKLVTLSYRDSAPEADMEALVTKASGMLGLMMMTQMGMGLKPVPLQELLPESEQKFMRKLNDSLQPIAAVIDGIFGNADYRSRVEPMTDAYANLLPAVDGILPNEIDPLNKVVYFNHF